jgi:hypothetical protein
MNLSGDHSLGDAEALCPVVVNTVLRAAQQRVTSGRPAEPGAEAPEPGEPADGAMVVGAS